MGKKAILIGCNYPGTKAELKGCVNDVHRMRRSLVDRFGFAATDIAVLIDTDDSYTQPTGGNIRRAINRLVLSGRPGDHLFVHFSGHGARLPADPSDHDNTGYHECIVPCDMNLIVDEDFRRYADKIPNGCRLTIVADSCNSGGLLENAKEQIGESTKSGRALPLSHVADILKKNTGIEEIRPGNLRSAILGIFGEAASPRLRVRNTATEELEGYRAGEGILISACQSDQNAADAKPVSSPEGAFGALSNAIQGILGEAEGRNLSNREVVAMAREMLEKKGFTQRPGLYCSDEDADERFLA
ncbi:Metacaspase-6 [Apostasia shenzhenica]|uniref:Metacaspase-6 n=1 Tax=Apostasia shenzhenica TaxID=1088818 RepID=A0A2H9ZTR7_9ASPA|nr:Metacaspase-6 [Apostasia shenzhenica]